MQSFISYLLVAVFSGAVYADLPVPNLGPQLSEVNSYNAARFTECRAFIQTCAPTKASCASVICAQCTGLGATPINSCCKDATPVTCFQNLGGSPASASITQITSAAADANQIACSTADNLISSCSSIIPNFDNVDNSVAASCICYSGSSWVPSRFDNAANSCVAWAKTADVSDLQDFSALVGFCSSVGNVASGAAASTTGGAGSTAAATGAATSAATGAGTGSGAGTSTPSATSSPTASHNAAGRVHAEIYVAIVAVVAALG